MRLMLIIVLSSVICMLSFAQPIKPELLYSIEYKNGFYYQNDALGTSPIQFAPIDSHNAWIGQIKNGFVIDLFSGKIEMPIPYTENKSGGYDVDFVFGNGWAVGNRGNPVVMYIDLKQGSVSDFKYYYDDNDSYKLMISNAYIINDHAFFFQEDGTLFCIPKGKNPLSTNETNSLLNSWKPSETTGIENKTEKQLELLSTGKFLIADGIIYPSTDQNFREYLLLMGLDASTIKQRRGRGSPIIGVSAFGDIYIRNSDRVFVLNQTGSIQSTISLSIFFDNDINQERILTLSVHQNGDLYVMNAIQNDKIYIYKASRSWGL